MSKKEAYPGDVADRPAGPVTISENTRLPAKLVYGLLVAVVAICAYVFGFQGKFDTHLALDLERREQQASRDNRQDKTIEELASIQKPLLEQLTTTNKLLEMYLRQNTGRAER